MATLRSLTPRLIRTLFTTHTASCSSSFSSSAAATGSLASTITNHTELDHIHLRGLVFHGYHGVLAAEKSLGQKFTVDVTMGIDLSTAGRTDDLAHTADYAKAWALVRDEMTGPSRDLVECVAERIASSVLREFPTVADVRVGVQKPHVAIPGALTSMGIEIYRKRKMVDGGRL